MTTELGSVLVGIAALASTLVAWRQAHGAKRAAVAAIEASPSGVMASLRSEVEAVLDAHRQAMKRHTEERAEMEETIVRWRRRAEEAELSGVALRAEMAGLKIDLASHRGEISDLRTRVDVLSTRALQQ